MITDEQINTIISHVERRIADCSDSVHWDLGGEAECERLSDVLSHLARAARAAKLALDYRQRGRRSVHWIEVTEARIDDARTRMERK